MISGIDEAGRGSVIGPLVIAGVSFEEEDLPNLKKIGVKDSKLLSTTKREKLSEKIRDLAINYHVVYLSPFEIDRVVEKGKRLHKLNRFEAKAMAKVISILKPDIVYVDASDVLPGRFGDHIAENLDFNPIIVSEHKADVNYPIVSAASIIAKVERDLVISNLNKKYGNLGCGYPHDNNTRLFLRNWIKKHGEYPDFVRKSWKTSKIIRIESDFRQKKLF